MSDSLPHPWTAARQASLSFTISPGLLKLMSTESVMPPNHLILCRSPSPPAFNLFYKCVEFLNNFQLISFSHIMFNIYKMQLLKYGIRCIGHCGDTEAFFKCLPSRLFLVLSLTTSIFYLSISLFFSKFFLDASCFTILHCTITQNFFCTTQQVSCMYLGLPWWIRG